MSTIKGLELLHALYKDAITCKQDCLVLIIHRLLINSGKLCIGLTAEKQKDASELLPKEWNANKNAYNFAYKSSNNKEYVIKMAVTENNMVIIYGDVMADINSTDCFDLDFYVSDEFKDFHSVYKNVDKFIEKFEHLIKPEDKSKKDKINEDIKEPQPKSFFPSERYNPLRDPLLVINRPSPFPSVGRGDLDPFGGFDDGMLLFPQIRPLRPPHSLSPNFPRPHVPPGARYYPTNPFGSNFGGPDPDHLPPPGSSDMFM